MVLTPSIVQLYLDVKTINTEWHINLMLQLGSLCMIIMVNHSDIKVNEVNPLLEEDNVVMHAEYFGGTIRNCLSFRH